MQNTEGFVIRDAVESDVPRIMELINELAEYEKLTHELVATEDSLREMLFGDRPAAEAMMAECDGKPAGYAIFFSNCSTFLGRAGIYLEDVYVRPHLRGKGIGKAMLVRLAQIATQRKCGRLEWSVLNWNTPAIEFYKSIGAKPLDEWTMFRLTGESLHTLARSEP